jgi:hypothetical protein
MKLPSVNFRDNVLLYAAPVAVFGSPAVGLVIALVGAAAIALHFVLPRGRP